MQLTALRAAADAEIVGLHTTYWRRWATVITM
jgi:hypothetical protein